MSINRLIYKMWHIHIKEHYSATKRNYALIHATIWTNLVNIMISGISQTQKDKNL